MTGCDMSRTGNGVVRPIVADATIDLGREGHAYRHTRSNALLVADEDHIDALLTAVTGLKAASIPTWTPDAACTEGDVDESPDTLVVRDVHLLDAAQQRGLFEAISAWQGRVRVIATSPDPLYPLVAAQRFDEALYYRLNMLCVETN